MVAIPMRRGFVSSGTSRTSLTVGKRYAGVAAAICISSAKTVVLLGRKCRNTSMQGLENVLARVPLTCSNERALLPNDLDIIGLETGTCHDDTTVIVVRLLDLMG